MYLKRLQREYKDLQKEQPPFIEAHPDPQSILTWHFAIVAPSDSPYEEGIYWGIISFPPEYPMAPPSIKMMTPSGRFVPNRSICFSMSSYHPELWQPSWTVRSICIGFLSFMQTDEQTTGGMVSSDAEKRALAKASIAWNAKDPKFCKMFPHLVDGIPPKTETAAAAAASSSSASASTSDTKPAESVPVPAEPAAAPANAVPDVQQAPAAPVAPAVATPPKVAPLKNGKAPSEMSVKELKLALKELGLSSDDCVEKADMVLKLENALKNKKEEQA
jgi:ubiquitin-conjugating enzyme E2 J2